MRTNLIKIENKQSIVDGKLDMVIAFDTVSRDGKYRCMDMDISKTSKETGERLVNINTISQLIYNGIKYIVD